jgi:hypothetical protein
MRHASSKIVVWRDEQGGDIRFDPAAAGHAAGAVCMCCCYGCYGCLHLLPLIVILLPFILYLGWYNEECEAELSGADMPKSVTGWFQLTMISIGIAVMTQVIPLVCLCVGGVPDLSPSIALCGAVSCSFILYADYIFESYLGICAFQMGFFSAASDYHTLRGCGVMFRYLQIVGAITAIVTLIGLCIWCNKTEEPEVSTDAIDAMIAAAARDHGAASGAPRETTPLRINPAVNPV